MDASPTGPNALADPRTAGWLRRQVLFSAAAAVLSCAVGVPALFINSPAGAVLRLAFVLALCWSALGTVVWWRRRRVLASGPWRDATCVVESTATLFGSVRTTVAVTYPDGPTIRYRLDDLATARSAVAVREAGTVWVCSTPAGTVIATPGLGAAVTARPC